MLHVSCHAEPGRLVLESDTGTADKIDAARFVAEVLVPNEPVPLVVLAGCSTALSSIDGERALPGFARDLLHAGVPAVLAMTASVTDRYATDLCATLYGELVDVTGSPVVELNRAVAVGMADGPAAGLAVLDDLIAEDVPALRSYHLVPAVRGDLLVRLERPADARAEFERAAALTANESERRVLRARAAACAS